MIFVQTKQLTILENELKQSVANGKNQKPLRLRAIVCHHSFYGKRMTAGLKKHSLKELKADCSRL